VWRVRGLRFHAILFSFRHFRATAFFFSYIFMMLRPKSAQKMRECREAVMRVARCAKEGDMLRGKDKMTRAMAIAKSAMRASRREARGARDDKDMRA